jgi:hypothetical protein
MSPRNSDFSRHDLNPFSLCRNIQNDVIYLVMPCGKLSTEVEVARQ